MSTAYDLKTGEPTLSYEDWRNSGGGSSRFSDFFAPTTTYTSASSTYSGPSTTASSGPSTTASSGPPSSFSDFQDQYGYEDPIDFSGMIDTVSQQIQDSLANLPAYDEARAAAQQSIDIANQGLADLNANAFDPTAYRDATRGRISRNAKDIAQQSLSAIANRGQVNSSIGADFVSGKVNNYIADAFTDLEAAITEAELKDKQIRAGMYGTFGNIYANAATAFGNIDRNIANDRMTAINTSANLMKDLQSISTTQHADQRGWVELYDNMITSDAQRRAALTNARASATSAGAAASNAATNARRAANDYRLAQSADERAWRQAYENALTADLNRSIAAGEFQSNYTNPSTANPVVTYNDTPFVLGADYQYYGTDGTATGFYNSGSDVLYDNKVVGHIDENGRVTPI